MQTSIKTTVYAKILQKRLKELLAQRPKDMRTYKDNVAKWRREMTAWIKKNGSARVATISVSRETSRYHSERERGFDTSSFFSGAPKPPTWPDDTQIREIRGLLRHLAISYVQTTHISTQDVVKYLGDRTMKAERE